MLCGRPLIVSSKKHMSMGKPTASVVEEQQRFVDFVPAEIYRGQVLKTSSGLLPSDIRLLPLLR